MALVPQIGDTLDAGNITFTATVPRRRVLESRDPALAETLTWLTLRAANGNTTPVYVGTASNQTYPLRPGESIEIPISKLGEVWVKGDVDCQVEYLAVHTTGCIRGRS